MSAALRVGSGAQVTLARGEEGCPVVLPGVGAIGAGLVNFAAVAAVAICQMLHLSFITQYAWYVLVLGFIHPTNVINPPATVSATPALNGLVFLLVQLSFAWRIFAVSGKDKTIAPLSLLIIGLSLTQWGISIALAIGFNALRDNTRNYRLILKSRMIAHLITNMVTDTVITLSMVLTLYRFKRRTPVAPTRDLLTTLIMNTVENGLIITLFAGGNLLVSLLPTGGPFGIAFQFIIGGIYSVVLMATLNGREAHRKPRVSEVSLSLAEFATSPPTPGRISGRVRAAQDIDDGDMAKSTLTLGANSSEL
ncbi:hypothetical protein DFP72DRAFT_1105314 [Ephemerocybe angulata]|uniref:DUF6534 domain-containing protein n=1 Tax=Ephemerocybe angulata TaxID=980116 RepID=A0A8H6I5Z9_9AGAR|nr:hypothetical protein DFP72DRAFT_1105314 [Tulosesus angulatus]